MHDILTDTTKMRHWLTAVRKSRLQYVGEDDGIETRKLISTTITPQVLSIEANLVKLEARVKEFTTKIRHDLKNTATYIYTDDIIGDNRDEVLAGLLKIMSAPTLPLEQRMYLWPL